MRIAVAADHAGFPLNKRVIQELTGANHDAIDLGTHDGTQPDDYPDFARLVGESVQRGLANNADGAERGILICGSGVGACIAANKLKGVRACMCHDNYSAHQGVEHDDMNVLCLGARIIGVELALDLVRAFVNARFTGEERHRRRLQKINEMEQRLTSGAAN